MCLRHPPGIGLTSSSDIVAYPRRRSSRGSALWPLQAQRSGWPEFLGPHQRCPRVPLSVLGRTSRTAIAPDDVSGDESTHLRVGPFIRSGRRIDDDDLNDQEVTSAHTCRRPERLAHRGKLYRPTGRHPEFCSLTFSWSRKRRRIGAQGTARSMHRWIRIPASRRCGWPRDLCWPSSRT